jgi:hypothetical protein
VGYRERYTPGDTIANPIGTTNLDDPFEVSDADAHDPGESPSGICCDTTAALLISSISESIV